MPVVLAVLERSHTCDRKINPNGATGANFIDKFLFSGRDAEAEMTEVPGGRTCSDWDRISEPDDDLMDVVIADLQRHAERSSSSCAPDALAMERSVGDGASGSLESVGG